MCCVNKARSECDCPPRDSVWAAGRGHGLLSRLDLHRAGRMHTHMLKCILSFSAVVFGRVVEGMGLLKKLDSVGSRSGKPSQRVVVADSGELPSRRQILAKLQVRNAACIRNRFSVARLRNCVTCNWNSRSVRL